MGTDNLLLNIDNAYQPSSVCSAATFPGGEGLVEWHDCELDIGDRCEAVQVARLHGVPVVKVPEDRDSRAVRQLGEDGGVRLRIAAQEQISVRFLPSHGGIPTMAPFRAGGLSAASEASSHSAARIFRSASSRVAA